MGLAACSTSSSCTRTSPGDFTLGSMMAGGGRGDSMIAWRSASPSTERRQFTRTTGSTPPNSSFSANHPRVCSRAAALSFGAIASSRSTVTMSAPVASAFGIISGRLPGAKMRLRLGRIVRSLNVLLLFGGLRSVPRQCNGSTAARNGNR